MTCSLEFPPASSEFLDSFEWCCGVADVGNCPHSQLCCSSCFLDEELMEPRCPRVSYSEKFFRENKLHSKKNLEKIRETTKKSSKILKMKTS